MDDPGAFYAIALHTPQVRAALPRHDARERHRPPASHRGAAVRRALAHLLRAVAARLDTPLDTAQTSPRGSDPRFAAAQ